MSSARQTLLFTLAVCVVCAVAVSSAAVALKPRQEENALLDVRKQVLLVAGLSERGEKLPGTEINLRFEENLEPIVVNLETGEVDESVDGATFDQRAAARDPETSRVAAPNAAGVRRMPLDGLVYHVVEGGEVQTVILPIEGQGLWSTMYGFIALSGDLSEIRGITFYEHGETAGLGGEISNPNWQALWVGREAFDENWELRIEVIKGAAGPPDSDPFRVDGLAGATITARGVSATVQYWLGPEGFGPYLEVYRREAGIS
jgi:Na+-transporting NADH:ubiquinone oxidoreductase subunit C